MQEGNFINPISYHEQKKLTRWYLFSLISIGSTFAGIISYSLFLYVNSKEWQSTVINFRQMLQQNMPLSYAKEQSDDMPALRYKKLSVGTKKINALINNLECISQCIPPNSTLKTLQFKSRNKLLARGSAQTQQDIFEFLNNLESKNAIQNTQIISLALDPTNNEYDFSFQADHVTL